VGAEAFVASPVGQIGVDVAASRREGRFTADDREGEGYAVNASLTASLGSGGDGGAGALGGQSVALVYEYRSADFAVPGSGPVSNPFSSRFGASWSLSLADAGYLTIDARHAIGRDSTTDESSASVSYGRRLFGSMSLSASAILTRSAGADDFAWRIGLIRRIGREASAQIEYDGASETTRLSLQHARGSGVGSTSTALALDHAQGRSGVTATGSYIGNRFQAGANLNRIESGFGSSGTRLALRLGTALVHADGATALSRPVSDSFAILVPHPTLAGSQVRMGQANATADAMSGVWGGAVDSRLSAFSPRRLVYSVPDAPAGYDIGTGEVIVSPLYRSGYRVVIGSDYTLTVLGRLMGPNGEPRALVAGELREQDGPGREPVLLLTNREGVFGVSGLRPGAWVLTFPGDETTSYLLTVPGSGESIVRIGDVLPVVVRHVAGRTP
jgi:outer membrane usher protein